MLNSHIGPSRRWVVVPHFTSTQTKDRWISDDKKHHIHIAVSLLRLFRLAIV